jgi:hypothetical protein
MAQRDAQEQLLGLKMLKPHDLAWMYHAQGHEIAAMWERIFFAESPLRITLSELPQEQGALRRARPFWYTTEPRPCLAVGRSISRRHSRGGCAHSERSTARQEDRR